MLPQASARFEPRCPLRGSLAAVGGLLILVVFVWGVGIAASAPAQKDDTKKTETTKDKAEKEEPKKDDRKKERAGKDDTKKDDAKKDDTKKSDADKEIDELVKEMARNQPNQDAATLQRIREQVQNMPAERRKYMLNMLKNRNQPGFPGKPQVGGPMAPGFAWMFQNPRLGARVEPVSDTLAEQLDLPKGKGLVVREVVAESAAAKAGIKAHDVLVEFNGKAVPNQVDEFARMMTDIKSDKAVEMVVMRKGKKETIKDIKLPEVKAGQPGFAPGGFPGAGRPPGGFPQPPGGFPQAPGGFGPPAFGAGGAGAVITTIVRTGDRLTLRHQEGNFSITLSGRMADGKPKINDINIQDAGRMDRYESVDKVPERYRDQVKNLMELGEKSSVRSERKSDSKSK